MLVCHIATQSFHHGGPQGSTLGHVVILVFQAGFGFFYAAACGCDCHFGTLLYGRDLLVGARCRKAARAQRDLADDGIPAYVWPRVSWTLHGVARWSGLGSHWVGVIPLAQLGALDRDGCNCGRNCVARAEDFGSGTGASPAVVRTADCAAGCGSVLSCSISRCG